jgi:hypothetical protein
MENLTSLKSTNPKISRDIVTHGIRYTYSEPSKESKLFRVEKQRKSSVSLISNILIKSGIVGLIALGLSLVDSKLVNHPDFRILASIIVWLFGVVLWVIHSKSVSNEIVAESVLAVRGLGIQLFSETRGGKVNNVVFLKLDKVVDVLIIEGFTALKVITYIGIEVSSVSSNKKPKSLILPFQFFELPISLIAEITKGLRITLDLNRSE